MACDDVVLRRFADAQRDVNTVLNQADAAIVHHHFQRHIRIAAQVIGKMRLQQRALYFHRYRQAQHTLRRVQTLPHAANCLFGAIQHHPRMAVEPLTQLVQAHAAAGAVHQLAAERLFQRGQTTAQA